ncbi:hypothetical protein LC065_01925 [Halobacillus litoralis]|uniref:hypothetical protein n=1 Tax=Halobacillus litoralis TaxID=45668 RepID=UPI00273F1E4B|nr:hypothetical protein [Halobacillus litoralis]WLR48063.1 hypothetical protein LC065_01925 [Halobacillus litoralis]
MKKPTIFLAGDSTMADYPSSSHPQMGWGQKLFSYFTDEVCIIKLQMEEARKVSCLKVVCRK